MSSAGSRSGSGAASTAGLAAVVFTPLAGVWYGTVSGLSPELTAFSIVPGMLLVLLPFIEAVLSYQRGVLVKAHRTTPISVAVAVQLGVTTLVFVLMVLVLKTVGAVVGRPRPDRGIRRRRGRPGDPVGHNPSNGLNLSPKSWIF